MEPLSASTGAGIGVGGGSGVSSASGGLSLQTGITELDVLAGLEQELLSGGRESVSLTKVVPTCAEEGEGEEEEEVSDLLLAGLDKALEDCAVMQMMLDSDLCPTRFTGIEDSGMSDTLPDGGGVAPAGDILLQGSQSDPKDVRQEATVVSSSCPRESDGGVSPSVEGVQNGSVTCDLGWTAEEDYVIMTSAGKEGLQCEGRSSGGVASDEMPKRWEDSGRESSISSGSWAETSSQHCEEEGREGVASASHSHSNGPTHELCITPDHGSWNHIPDHHGSAPDHHGNKHHVHERHGSWGHAHERHSSWGRLPERHSSWGHMTDRGSGGRDSERNLDSPSSLSKELCPLYEDSTTENGDLYFTDSTDGGHMYSSESSLVPTTCRLSVYSLRSAFTYLDAQGEGNNIWLQGELHS